MRFELDRPQVGDGMRLLRSIRRGVAHCVVFDPQYRGVLDHLDYGNEGARQQGRAELPETGEETIVLMLHEIARVLVPGRYCLMWLDKFSVSEGLYAVAGLKRVDLITWRKPSFGMGWRARRVSEYLRVLQKAPIDTSGWTDHGIPDVVDDVPDGPHAHAKPHALQRRLIEAITRPGETVVDPCAGGYSSMRSAHAAGRRFLGCDLVEFSTARVAAE